MQSLLQATKFLAGGRTTSSRKNIRLLSAHYSNSFTFEAAGLVYISDQADLSSSSGNTKPDDYDWNVQTSATSNIINEKGPARTCWADLLSGCTVQERKAILSLSHVCKGSEIRALLKAQECVKTRLMNLERRPVAPGKDVEYIADPLQRSMIQWMIDENGSMRHERWQEAMSHHCQTGFMDAWIHLIAIGNMVKLLVSNPHRDFPLIQLLKKPYEYLLELKGDAGTWHKQDWFQHACSQGQPALLYHSGCNNADSGISTMSMASRTLDMYRKLIRKYKSNLGNGDAQDELLTGVTHLSPEEHLAWYLIILSNALSGGEGMKPSSPFRLDASSADVAMKLLMHCPLADPPSRVVDLFEDVLSAAAVIPPLVPD